MRGSLWCGEEGGAAGGVSAHWDPVLSGERVIETLLLTEERYLPPPSYLTSVQRHPHCRDTLATWTLEVCSEWQSEEGVPSLSLALLDRALAAAPVRTDSLWLLGAACLLLACKLRQGGEGLGSRQLCAATPHRYSTAQLREMERVVLTTLRWDVAAVTPHDFLPHFLSALGLGETQEQEEEEREGCKGLLTTIRRHADTLVAMCVCDVRFLGTPPSLIAAATLNSALRGLGYRGPCEGMTNQLAGLCRADPALLRFYTEQVEGALKDRLQAGMQRERQKERGIKGEEERESEGKRERKESGTEGERSSTPTNLRDVEF